MFVEAARLADEAYHGREADALAKRDRWLARDHVSGSFEREPLHWPLVFPEVFENGGFDAVIGNPPFLGGQKLTGTLGTAYREYLVQSLGRAARGSADLVSYFALRAHDVLHSSGQTGLIATNTLAQGDTREVGLDQLIGEGVVIRKAVKSKPWPAKSAALEFCAIWTSRSPLDQKAQLVADGVVVAGINASLDPTSRIRGNAERLVANSSLSFIGSYVLGLGFTMSPDEAVDLVEKNSGNKDVLFPYLNGQDLNSRPGCSASRWVINFHDWDESRARRYVDCFDQVVRLVKPERLKVKFSKNARERWWAFERSRPELYAMIAGLERVIVITLVSKTVMPVMVATGQVFSHMLGVFASDDAAMLALLSAAPHYWWTVSRASTMKADLRYTPSDVFETLPLPPMTDAMRELGERLDRRRREIMLARNAGLTATYHLVNDVSCRDGDIVELRRIHEAIDVAVCEAYGWYDLVKQGIDHGYHKTGPYIRYTVGPAAQREMVDLLLELNHQRYAEEVAQGLHAKKKAAPRKAAAEPAEQETMF